MSRKKKITNIMWGSIVAILIFLIFFEVLKPKREQVEPPKVPKQIIEKECAEFVEYRSLTSISESVLAEKEVKDRLSKTEKEPKKSSGTEVIEIEKQLDAAEVKETTEKPIAEEMTEEPIITDKSTKNLYSDFLVSDIEYMQRCIETEVYQAPLKNKINVANVIFNRIDSPRFSGSATDIITAPNQFAYFRTEISDTTIEALEIAYNNPDTTYGAIAFKSGTKPAIWLGLERKFIDEVGHGFY